MRTNNTPRLSTLAQATLLSLLKPNLRHRPVSTERREHTRPTLMTSSHFNSRYLRSIFPSRHLPSSVSFSLLTLDKAIYRFLSDYSVAVGGTVFPCHRDIHQFRWIPSGSVCVLYLACVFTHISPIIISISPCGPSFSLKQQPKHL